MTFVTIDFVFLAVLAVAMVRGLVRGFIEELFSVAALVLGVVAAVAFSPLLAGPLEQAFRVVGWGRILAFLVIFLIVYIAVKIIEKGLKALFEKANLSNLDKALGVFLGLIEGLLLVSGFMLLVKLQPFVSLDGLLARSFFAEYLLPLVLSVAASAGLSIKPGP